MLGAFNDTVPHSEFTRSENMELTMPTRRLALESCLKVIGHFLRLRLTGLVCAK